MWKELIIDLTAIRHNIRMIKTLLAEDTLLMGVVKSDAYGHGMIPISHVLKEEGVDYLGVAFLDEALKIRASGIDLPVVILTGIESGLEADTVIKHNFITVLYDMEMIEALNRAARRHGKTVNIFLKVDTGMGRLGLLYEELWTVLERIKRLKNIELIGLFSHLSCADDPKRDDFTRAPIPAAPAAARRRKARGKPLPRQWTRRPWLPAPSSKARRASQRPRSPGGRPCVADRLPRAPGRIPPRPRGNSCRQSRTRSRPRGAAMPLPPESKGGLRC